MCLQLAVGVLQMGFIINFLSHAVISGFTSGAAVIIGLSQIKYFLGVHPAGNPKKLIGMLEALFDALDQTKWEPLVMGLLFLCILLGMKNL